MASDVRLTITPTSASELAGLEGTWRALEDRARRPMLYTSYDWLRAWLGVLGAQRPLLLRADAGEGTVALGLLQTDHVRNLRFAGGDLTPTRRPLCAAGTEDAVWSELAAWLRRHPRGWSTFEATGVGPFAAEVPGADVDPVEGTVLDLPGSFEDHLATLSERNRNEVRRRLRRAAESGLDVRRVVGEDVEGALEDFLAFHLRRAAEAQIATVIDERALGLLRAATAGDDELDVVEVVAGDRRLAVSLNVVHREVMFPYAIGWDPSASAFAPGILLTLDTITEGLRRGLRAVDMGPGTQRYKLSLGFERVPAHVLRATNGSLAGRSLRAAARVAARARARR